MKVRRVSVRENRRSLESNIEIAGVPWQLSLTLADGAPELDLELAAPPQTPLTADLSYPFPVSAPGREYRIVLPHKTGLLFSVEDATLRNKAAGKYGCYMEAGLSMPWFGMTDLKRGLMIIFETPADAGVDVRLGGGDTNRVFSPQVYWRSARDTVGYARKLRYRILDGGGYVAMCKYYRNRLIRTGEFVSLREKERSCPALAKLIGAMFLRLRGRSDQDQIETVKFLESKGVKRMLIHTGASAETVAQMREQSHLVGAYKIYTDIRAPRPGLGEEWARGYTQDAYIEKDGTPMRGYAYTEKSKPTYRCSLRQLPLMEELLPPLLREKKYESIMLDVTTAMGPRECYHPEHRVDRRQDLQQRIQILKSAAGLGVVLGSEDGNDWAVPYLHYFEGTAMPRRFGIGVISDATWPRPFDLSEEYIGVDLNERVRAPLWDLVFHDSVVTSWRWDCSPDRYSDAKWWDKHDLLLLIAGNMPFLSVNRQHAETIADRLLKSYHDVAEWYARIGWDELVDHRALTADRSVQESRFSSGWAVTVNFSEARSYTAGDGVTVKPFSYRIHRWKK